jgi:Cd2+/Zn2+-exporting ATPase
MKNADIDTPAALETVHGRDDDRCAAEAAHGRDDDCCAAEAVHGRDDDDCCAACAAAHGRRKEGPGEGRILRIGSYSLPMTRALVFGAALSLWALGFVLSKLCPPAASGTVFLPFLGAAAGFIRGAGRGSPGDFLPFTPLLPFIAAYMLAGLPVLRKAWQNLRRGHALDENFLMSIATLGAFAVGEWEEAVGVMIFYMIGELIQEAAVERSRNSIDALLALKPDTARIKTGDTWTEVAAETVSPGTLVLVRPGERIPLDGLVSEGAGAVDASMLTGESRPVDRKAEDEVRSGTLSLDGVLVIRTTKTADNSSAAKIISLVESAREAKAKPERFITAFAKWYTPLVVGAATLLAVLPPLLLPGAVFADWLYRALILLVISCPCALVVSIPLGYFAGIGGMSRRGIMVKGAVHLDSLRKAKYVAFDKTGTLTRGKFSITAVEPAGGMDERRLLETAVLAERESNHPIAEAIRAEGKARGIEAEGQGSTGRPAAGAAAGAAGEFREIAGRGLELRLSLDQAPAGGPEPAGGPGPALILAGNRGLLESRGVAVPREEQLSGKAEANTAVYIARDGRYCGRILIGDTLKEGAEEAVRRLRGLGIAGTVMFTGDARQPALAAASRLGISAVEAELLPQDKLRELEKLTRQGTTVFVGDGINDAPVLARSDVGIAMGSGADAAVEAADVIIMTDDPRRVPESIERARKTRRIVLSNVAFALGAKGIFITLAVLGLANMWIALIADVGVALAAILNSSRALR